MFEIYVCTPWGEYFYERYSSMSEALISLYKTRWHRRDIPYIFDNKGIKHYRRGATA